MAQFIVEDNPNRLFSDEEIKVTQKRRNASLVWKMSFEELVELQTTIATFIAGERG